MQGTGAKNGRNYQREMEQVLSRLDQENPPRLLLHGCCAPCSSYVLEYLSVYFQITLFFYNPNISSFEEYRKREEEAKRLIASMPLKNPVQFMEAPWENDRFEQAAKGLEQVPEGGSRCFACYKLRLEKTAETAAKLGFPYFTTTLTISPLKNAAKLNELGEEAAARWNLCFLPSDFKKKNGYKRSIELSHQYNLYRQNYCGCVYSQAAAENRERNRGLSGTLEGKV